MKEQTKVLILLSIVIIIAVGSLIFVFYQYAKIQSQVKTQFTPRIVDAAILNQINYQPEQNCQTQNCYYDGEIVRKLYN